MAAVLSNLQYILGLMVWLAATAVGGIWLVRSAFRVRPNEEMLSGIVVGLIIENLLANGLAQILPVLPAFYLAAALTLLLGAVFWLSAHNPARGLLRIPIAWRQLLCLGLLVVVFFSINRGLAIFDDYQNIPITSQLAAGDVPPHFSLDPGVEFDYHYGQLLYAAQIMRIADIVPWTALDLTRAMTIALPMMMAYLWVRRLTRSTLAGVLGSIFSVLATGTRWLLLLLPPGVVQAISGRVEMMGSGAQTAPDLASALTRTWAIEGGGPLGFPFAFLSSSMGAGVMNLGGGGNIASAGVVILLTVNRWQGWQAFVLTTLLYAAAGLGGEVGTVVATVAWVLVTLFHMLRNRTWRIPRSLLAWLGVVVVSRVLIVLQGGLLSSAFQRLVSGLLGEELSNSYFSLKFGFHWPPTLVSAHFGRLSLFDPATLLVALLDIGPVLLALPLIAAYAVKSYRSRRWPEVTGMVGGLISLGALFFMYEGNAGPSATGRLYLFLGMCKFWAFPLVWLWAARRGQMIKAAAAGLGVMAVMGGMVLFGMQLIAAQKPVATYFIEPIDARMQRAYWNKLEPDALIFDNVPSRPATIFARLTNAYSTWYVPKPEWVNLVVSPTPQRLLEAGFRYAYVDDQYWDALGPADQAALMLPCVKKVQEYRQPDPADLTRDEFRWLLDLSGCK